MITFGLDSELGRLILVEVLLESGTTQKEQVSDFDVEET